MITNFQINTPNHFKGQTIKDSLNVFLFLFSAFMGTTINMDEVFQMSPYSSTAISVQIKMMVLIIQAIQSLLVSITSGVAISPTMVGFNVSSVSISCEDFPVQVMNFLSITPNSISTEDLLTAIMFAISRPSGCSIESEIVIKDLSFHLQEFLILTNELQFSYMMKFEGK